MTIIKKNPAVSVTQTSIFVNLILTVFKLICGMIAHSSLMIYDAIHSASDVISSVLVLLGLFLSRKEKDQEHPYGHERLECVAAVILAAVLCFTGLFMGHEIIEKIKGGPQASAVPGGLAIVGSIVSILVKEGLFFYTIHYAKKLDSALLTADAWHHRTDSLSSIGAFIGIYGTRKGYLWLEKAAGLLICAFILIASYRIFVDAVIKMTDHSGPQDLQEQIKKFVFKQNGVLGVKAFTTRQFSDMIYVDLNIYCDQDLTLLQADQITKTVHDAVEEQFPMVKHISVKASPYNKEDSFDI